MSAPWAVCPVDGEPLVGTFEFAGFEWICVPCGRLYTWFSPSKAQETPELVARHAALRAEYREARASRERAS